MYNPNNYSGGDGSTFEKAIRIQLDGTLQGVSAEHEYLAFRFHGQYKPINQAFVEKGNFKYDVHQVLARDGKNEETIIFDISRFHGKGLEGWLDDFMKE